MLSRGRNSVSSQPDCEVRRSKCGVFNIAALATVTRGIELNSPHSRLSLGLGGSWFVLEATVLNHEIPIGQTVEGTVYNAD